MAPAMNNGAHSGQLAGGELEQISGGLVEEIIHAAADVVRTVAGVVIYQMVAHNPGGRA